MEETSLSDFVDGRGDREGDASPSDDEGESADGPTITASWSPGTRACAGCGEAAGWLWAEGGERVCRDCKDW